MLRRKPTALTLTTEDIAIYEDARAREALEREQREIMEAQQAAAVQAQRGGRQMHAGADQNIPLSTGANGGREQQVKSREERLGLSGRN